MAFAAILAPSMAATPLPPPPLRPFHGSPLNGGSMRPNIPLSVELRPHSPPHGTARRSAVPAQSAALVPTPSRHVYENLPLHNQVELSEEQRSRRVREAEEEILREIERRRERLREAALSRRLDSELKFGKLLLAQGKYLQAIAHFDKVISKSSVQSWRYTESMFEKAQCLSSLGRREEAKNVYQGLLLFRAPFPHIKRRAALALLDMEGGRERVERGGREGRGERGESRERERGERGEREEGENSEVFDDYRYRMYSTRFGAYMAKEKEKYEESAAERMAMWLVPLSVLMMGPLIIVTLLLTGKGH